MWKPASKIIRAREECILMAIHKFWNEYDDKNDLQNMQILIWMEKYDGFSFSGLHRNIK